MRGGIGRGKDVTRLVGFKKFKSISALPSGVGLKSSPISSPLPLHGGGGEGTHMGRSGEGRVKWSETKLSSLPTKFKTFQN